MDKRNESISLLNQAINHGLRPSEQPGLEKDSDLKSLHSDSRFAKIVARAKAKAAEGQKLN